MTHQRNFVTRAVSAMIAFASVSSLLTACGTEELSELAETRGKQDPVTLSEGDIIPNRYIVVLKSGVAQRNIAGGRVSDIASTLSSAHSGKVVRTYEYALDGFVIDVADTELEALRGDSRVAYIEPDRMGSIVATQPNPTWGLDRIDQQALPLDASFEYPDQAGAGVHAYVVDTGVYAAHPEFAAASGGSRVIPGVDFYDNDADPDDCHGHGTHVAGTIGAATWGVAKEATLHSVKVCDCFGFCPISAIIAGVDWITNNHIKPAVANISLRTSYSQAENDAVTNSIAAGVTYAIAAANDQQDACLTSPGSTPNALTVGATDNTDTRASFSNFGSCVDLFAPGVNVTSTWTAPTLTTTISGTSMASPHVAGAAALFLGENPTATPAQVASDLLSEATSGVVQDPGVGSPNLLLYMGHLNEGSPSTPCAGLCSNPTQFTINGSYQSGQLGTGAVCLETTSVVHGGNCGNFVSPRTLSVNGETKPCNYLNWSSVPAPRNGGYCVQTTAGSHPWAYTALW